MKKIVLLFTICIFVLSMVTACKHPTKETKVSTVKTFPETIKDDIVKNTFVDDFGDQMEVIINHTQNTAQILLSGKTYELQKDTELPDYSAANSEYQYSNIHGNIIFMKKDADMVLFHQKKNKTENSDEKIASY